MIDQKTPTLRTLRLCGDSSSKRLERLERLELAGFSQSMSLW